VSGSFEEHPEEDTEDGVEEEDEERLDQGVKGEDDYPAKTSVRSRMDFSVIDSFFPDPNLTVHFPFSSSNRTKKHSHPSFGGVSWKYTGFHVRI